MTVFLPQQQHYPLFFMAELLAEPAGTATPAAGGATTYIIVTRSDPSQPWRIAMNLFDSGYDKPNPAIPPPQVDGAGYELMPASPSVSDASSWPALLAAYYTHLKDYGISSADTRFLPGPLTTGTNLTQRRQGYTNSYGVHASYRFAIGGPGEPWVLGPGQHRHRLRRPARVCDRNVGEAAHRLRADRRRPRELGRRSRHWPLPTIVTTWEWPICISDYPNGLNVGGPSSGGYPIHTGGVPASPGPGTTRVL